MHAMAFLLEPTYLAPLLAGSIYLPLTALKMAGLPVYANSEAWGWAAPSTLGWCALFALWGLVWWSVTIVVIKWRRRRNIVPSKRR